MTKLEFYIHQYIYAIVEKKVQDNKYKYKWKVDRSDFEEIDYVLQNASKNIASHGVGKPDLIYFNPDTKLLILVEIKKDKKRHSSNNLGEIKNPVDFAVDGSLHYASFFENYNRFAIAISGTPNDYLIDQFLIKEKGNHATHIPAQRILNEFDYENIISEKLINEKIEDLSSTLSSLNKDMDKNKIEVAKRPIILGAIIFSLTHFKQIKTDIEKLKYNSSNVSKLLVDSIKMKMIGMLPKNKWSNNNEIIARFCKLIESYSINNAIWQIIIKKVDKKLMPIINKMQKESYHDFSGDMYRVLLRYTSGDGKILGQVLTPKHIANLMIDLAELKKGDSVLDPACGTGIFLINSMNRLISMAETQDEINVIKSKKIYGIEISKEMFFLALVNMLINNDGKTNIYIDDNNPDWNCRGIFKYNKQDFLEQPKKIIMNPPYLSHDEMWNFILKSMEIASDRSVIIIPTSILNGNDSHKREFLGKHSLISVINMPNNIFQNKSSSGSQVKTSIIVVEINKPNKNNYLGTYFYDLKDDGFISSKKHGRYDGNNRWNLIKDNFLNNYHMKIEIQGISKIIKNLDSSDSWHFNFFNKIEANDFSKINTYLFNLLQSLIDKKYNGSIEGEIFKAKLIFNLNISDFKIGEIDYFPAKDILALENKYNKALRIEKYDSITGDISYIAAANQNNGSRINSIRNIYNETIFKNKITWNTQGDGGAGLAFYHPYKFIAASTTLVLAPLHAMTIERKLFLSFAMSLENKNRYHGNAITKKEFHEGGLTIALPINASQAIDWELIDVFMKNNKIVKKIMGMLEAKI